MKEEKKMDDLADTIIQTEAWFSFVGLPTTQVPPLECFLRGDKLMFSALPPNFSSNSNSSNSNPSSNISNSFSNISSPSNNSIFIGKNKVLLPAIEDKVENSIEENKDSREKKPSRLKMI